MAPPPSTTRKGWVSSWGGRAVQWLGGDGRYHAFFSEFGGTCGMDRWDNTSHIAHMVADSPDPDGGYRRWQSINCKIKRNQSGRLGSQFLWPKQENGVGGNSDGCSFGCIPHPLHKAETIHSVVSGLRPKSPTEDL
eukprot:gene57952-biopygen17663